MGREFASACARWLHLLDVDFRPEIVAMCDPSERAREWFERSVPTVRATTADHRELLDRSDVDAVYCAVPHDLHEQVYIDTLEAGKHLLGEKPFGIDARANQAIAEVAVAHPELLVRCSSEFPFFPGALAIIDATRSSQLGRVFEVRITFSHCSDLDPTKKINWKRMKAQNGEYGVMGDLGMHAVHVPLRLGWLPSRVFALLSNIVTERPDDSGGLVPCETWDNATLACDTVGGFPLVMDLRRIAPGETNTWSIEVLGMRTSMRWSSKSPKTLWRLDYEPGGPQSWSATDLGYSSTYPTIIDGIFEFGFSDSLLQMWAAYCDELVHGDEMRGRLRCVTLEETAMQHALFTGALRSAASSQAIELDLAAAGTLPESSPAAVG
jgi:predicted dehydrogenase